MVRLRGWSNVTGVAALAAVASPPVLTAAVPNVRNGFGSHAPITTSFATVTVTGGTAPYSYVWARISADPETWTISNTTGAGTSFTCQDVADEHFATAQFQCTVTDAAARVAISNALTANATATG
jgi:hypothetical protein